MAKLLQYNTFPLFDQCLNSHSVSLPVLPRTNNPAILQLLLSLSSSFSTCPLAQELTTKTVVACPDLMLSYLRSISFSFEPRPTSKWVTNMEFLIRVCTVFHQPSYITLSCILDTSACNGSAWKHNVLLCDVASGIVLAWEMGSV